MSLVTLNGVTVTRCRVQVPAWGVWFADVECASGDVLTGAVTLVVDDVTFRGTILSGGTVETRTRYRIAGGAGQWGKRIAAKAYINDLGVKSSKVVTDAAAECGETVGTLPSGTAGSSFVRAEGPASAVPDELYPRGWYVDEAGVTQIGARTSTTYEGGAVRTATDAARGTIELAAPSLVGLVPGVVVDGITAVDVEHILEGGKLRTMIWGAQAGRDGDPVAAKLAQFVDLCTAPNRYFAPYEYRIVLRHTERYDLQCVRRSTGMPDLLSVRIKPGVAGVRSHPKLGSLAIVQFVNGDPGRPVISGFDDFGDLPNDPGSGGFISDEMTLMAGTTASDTEHATSAEATVNFVYTLLSELLEPLVGQPTIDAAFTAALAAVATSELAAPIKTAIDLALSSKAVNTNGRKPSIGWPKVLGG